MVNRWPRLSQTPNVVSAQQKQVPLSWPLALPSPWITSPHCQLPGPWDAYSRGKEMGSYSFRQGRMLNPSTHRHSGISRFHLNSNQSFLHDGLNTDISTSTQMSFLSPPANLERCHKPMRTENREEST